MYKVNILTKVKYKSFSHVFNTEKYRDLFDVYENSGDDCIWDIVVVYEGNKIPQNLRYREGGLIFISGEPPLSRVYPIQFVKQFDVFHTTHRIKYKNVENGHLAINWHFSMSFKYKTQKYSFEQLRDLPKPHKSRPISIITSNKRMMPGHNLRRNLIERLKKDFGDYIDFYGDGINNVEYKCDALLPYYFHICFENIETKDYWSEKFADPLLGYCIPIYVGCTNIENYFDKNGFVKFSYNDYDKLKSVICEIIKNPKSQYEKYYSSMLINRRLLLNKYTLFDLLFSIVKDRNLKEAEVIEKKVLPYEYCRFYKLQYNIMRFKRFMLKLYINRNI